MRDQKLSSGRAAILVLALIALSVVLLGITSSRRVTADEPNEHALRLKGPADLSTWPDDSKERIVGGGGGGAGKDCHCRDGGAAPDDKAGKPVEPQCDCTPSGR